MSTPLIAVSGDRGSFSEEAGRLYAQRCGIDAEFLFALDMEGVLAALDSGDAAIGIFPVVNSRGGLVKQAFTAMGSHFFDFFDEVWLEVHQCLMALPGVRIDEITAVATHSQALAQCDRFLKTTLPNAERIEWIDTAKAAADLAAGKFQKTTAVIAPARSAEIFGLSILQRGIQDEHPNLTTFIVVRQLQKP